jgi:hypothetical protein
LSDPTVYAKVDSSDVDNKIALRSHTISYEPADDSSPSLTGTTFTYYMHAENILGSVISPEFSIVLADVPDQPTTVPQLNLEFTSATAIHADYQALETVQNGGSEILSYELQVYRLENSAWQSVTGGYN